MKRAAIYARVSTPDQHVETQLYDLRKLAAKRGFEVSREYCDRGISGSKARVRGSIPCWPTRGEGNSQVFGRRVRPDRPEHEEFSRSRG